LIDGVLPDAPGSREIGFSVPDRYNAVSAGDKIPQ
jgi:hypothetical protein